MERYTLYQILFVGMAYNMDNLFTTDIFVYMEGSDIWTA